MIDDNQLRNIDTKLNRAQVVLNEYEAKLPDGDVGIRRVQTDIDNLFALFNRARKNPGSMAYDNDFAPGFQQLDAEMADVATRAGPLPNGDVEEIGEQT
jgi:hypothetical protein